MSDTVLPKLRTIERGSVVKYGKEYYEICSDVQGRLITEPNIGIIEDFPEYVTESGKGYLDRQVQNPLQ